MAPFLASRRRADPNSWTVVASAHAARWARGCGELPEEDQALDPRECSAIAQRFGRIPAEHIGAAEGSYGATLVRAVEDDGAFERLFASLFGAALFGVERAGRRAALAGLPGGFSARVLREFEVLRARGERPVVGPNSLFDLSVVSPFRAAVGAVVAREIGPIFAEELSTLCRGWSAWVVPPAEAPPRGALIDAWLSLFEEADD